MDDRRTQIMDEIRTVAIAAGHTWKEQEGFIYVDTIHCRIVVAETRGFGAQRGRLRIKIGNYGSVRQFPEPTAGFNFPKIVREIEAAIEGTRADRARTDKANRLRQELLNRAQEIIAAAGPGPVRLRVNPVRGYTVQLDISVNPDHAATLIQQINAAVAAHQAAAPAADET